MFLLFLEVRFLISENFDIVGFININSQIDTATVVRKPIVRNFVFDYFSAILDSNFPSDDSSCVRFISIFRSRANSSDLLLEIPIIFDQENKFITVSRSLDTKEIFNPGDSLVVSIHGDPCSVDFNIAVSIALRLEIID